MSKYVCSNDVKKKIQGNFSIETQACEAAIKYCLEKFNLNNYGNNSQRSISNKG